MLSKNNRLIGAIFLVSGTTIGAGMLALPITTGLAGFIPSLLIITVIWLYMLLTAFYFLEVNLRIQGESNFISMTRKTLGSPGVIIAWITYLLLLYALMAAYLLGCSQILNDFLKPIVYEIPHGVWPVAIFLFFSAFLYLGTRIVDFLNRLMMIGLIFAYVFIIGLGCCSIQPIRLMHTNWSFLLPSISVVLTTFGFHVILPTLTTYLDRDPKLLKRAIFIGSLIPFLVYLLWQLLVMGVVPVYGQNSLWEASEKGLQITFFLKTLLASQWVGIAVHWFAFFAIVTSLLGVGLSLIDFLADGLKVKKTPLGKFFLILLTFIPPLIFSLFYPRGFIVALRYAGIFVVILLGVLPALMAWFERYHSSSRTFISTHFKVPGGKFLLGITILFSLILLSIEVFL